MYYNIIESLQFFDADNDLQFREHFIETVHLKRISNNNSNIIFGTKGTGKTALKRAISELNKNQYLKTSSLDLVSVSFSAIYSKIEELQKTIKQEAHNISRAAWKNILLFYAISSVFEDINDSILKKKIQIILEEEKFIKPNGHSASEYSNRRLMSAFSSIYDYVIKLPFSETENFSAISTEQSNVINKFPLNDKLNNILNEILSYIVRTDKKVLVCIDGLDSIIEHTEISRQVIFAGLIDAVYQLKSDKRISPAFCFKAFLPQELTIEAKRVNWDRDKSLKDTHYISWDKEDLKSFIKKRFAPFSKKGFTKFEDIWAEFFPEKVLNKVYNTEENTFEYILRHTFYRPRQLQDHIHTIMVKWVEKNGGTKIIDSSFIPNVLADNNRKLTDVLVDQLSYIFPNILKFLASWKRSNTFTNVKDFRERINTYLTDKNNNSNEIDKIFDYLYVFGIFGISEDQSEITNWNKFKKFHFAFVDEATKINTSISHFVDEDAIIGFSPMLKEFCKFSNQNEYIICPTKEDEN